MQKKKKKAAAAAAATNNNAATGGATGANLTAAQALVGNPPKAITPAANTQATVVAAGLSTTGTLVTNQQIGCLNGNGVGAATVQTPKGLASGLLAGGQALGCT